MVIESAKVRSNGRLAQGIYAMELVAPMIASTVKPGQFVNVLIDDGWWPLLRRPMSVAACKDERISLIYKVFGIGTQAMASWPSGQVVNLLGPLGNGWHIMEGIIPVLIGGGVGIAPISFLHDEFNARSIEHYLVIGARDKAEHYLSHAPDENITLTTDNGTIGIKGTAVDGLKIVLEGLSTSKITIFGCGPLPMLEALKSFVLEQGLPCQLAVEEMMGCGFGICQGCSVEMRIKADPAQPGYHQRFRLACTDGPVFWAHELA